MTAAIKHWLGSFSRSVDNEYAVGRYYSSDSPSTVRIKNASRETSEKPESYKTYDSFLWCSFEGRPFKAGVMIPAKENSQEPISMEGLDVVRLTDKEQEPLTVKWVSTLSYPYAHAR